MDRLVELARRGRVELWITAAYDRDQERASPINSKANRRWLEDSPIRGVVPGPARLDYSVFDGPDILVDDDFGPVDAALRRIVLPGRLWVESMTERSTLGKRDLRKFHDVQHLGAHRLAGHDAFVTGDSDDILRKRDRITAQTGIIVWTLAEAVEQAETSGVG